MSSLRSRPWPALLACAALALVALVQAPGGRAAPDDPVLPARPGAGSAPLPLGSSVQPSIVASMELPRPGSRVGIGMPVRLRMSAPVPKADRRAVVQGLQVSADGVPVPGGWAWSSSRLVHFRPDDYWPAGATIQVSAGPSGPGSALRPDTWQFSTGKSLVLRVDGARHRMQVLQDGAEVRTIKVSLGKPGWRTRNGVKVVMSLHRGYTMRGTDENGPYRITVEHAFRLTPSGEFVHSAPWSVSWQGRDNRSHGCTNISPQDARWLAQRVQVGTPVEFRRTGGDRMTLLNGWGEWNLDPDSLMRPSSPPQAR